MAQNNTHARENLMSEPNAYDTSLLVLGSVFVALLKTVAPVIAKRNTNMLEAITPSQGLSVRYAISPLQILQRFQIPKFYTSYVR